MHDIDRAMFEMAGEFESTGELYETFETGETEFEAESETHELELVTELLEVTSEAELDRFLGNLIGSAGSAIGSFARSGVGQALGGVLKTAARQALPQIGQIIGNAVAPGQGGQLGARAGQWLGTKFEMEGLSNEDREFETARGFVRFAQTAVRNAARNSPTSSPVVAAQQAAIASAQQHAPALVGLLRSARPPTGMGANSSGRWVRSGNRIILLNL
jgi:hypothetical protein